MLQSPTRRLAAVVVGTILLATACAGGGSSGPEGSADDDGADDAPATTTEAVYPSDAWATVDPEAAGFDPAVLDELAAEAEANSSNCLLVTRHGQLVGEWYWNGTDESSAHEVFSATKSVTSTLVGIAQADGDLDVDDSASEYIPEWAGTEAEEVTVRNLISNDSGRHWDGGTDYQSMPRAADRTQFGIDLAQDDAPGTTWAYNNSAIQTLDAVLEEATGQQPAAYAEEKLLGPLGMTSSEMTTDPSGNTNMFFGLHSTCQDMARFGYLFLRNGGWDGEQLVPAEWVEEATGQSSQEINAGYGYLWWLNRSGPQGNPAAITTAEQSAEADARQMVPDAPEDMYWALGLGHQIVQVDPGSDTVVVRLGGGDTDEDFGPDFTARIVEEALVDP